MALEEFKVEQNLGYVAPVGADDSMAQVEMAKKQALAEQTNIKRESADAYAGDVNHGNAEGNLYMDIGLEMLGVKTISSVLQLADDRLADKNETGAKSKGMFDAGKNIDGEDLMARANIASSSIDLDKAHVNTDMWGGTDTKMSGVALARSLTVSKDIANEKVLNSVYAAERHHSAMIGQANQMVPGLSLGSGPSINPQQLLNHAEKIAELEDWQKRMQEAATA